MGAQPRRRASLRRFGLPLALAIIGYGAEPSFAQTLPQGSNLAGGTSLVSTIAVPPAVNIGSVPLPTSAPRTVASSPFPALVLRSRVVGRA